MMSLMANLMKIDLMNFFLDLFKPLFKKLDSSSQVSVSTWNLGTKSKSTGGSWIFHGKSNDVLRRTRGSSRDFGPRIPINTPSRVDGVFLIADQLAIDTLITGIDQSSSIAVAVSLGIKGRRGSAAVGGGRGNGNRPGGPQRNVIEGMVDVTIAGVLQG